MTFQSTVRLLGVGTPTTAHDVGASEERGMQMQIRNALPGEPEHHIFPQQTKLRKLRAWFEAKGIDIDKCVVKITLGEHDLVPCSHDMRFAFRV